MVWSAVASLMTVILDLLTARAKDLEIVLLRHQLRILRASPAAVAAIALGAALADATGDKAAAPYGGRAPALVRESGPRDTGDGAPLAS